MVHLSQTDRYCLLLERATCVIASVSSEPGQVKMSELNLRVFILRILTGHERLLLLIKFEENDVVTSHVKKCIVFLDKEN